MREEQVGTTMLSDKISISDLDPIDFIVAHVATTIFDAKL
jgi:hypothetical protein